MSENTPTPASLLDAVADDSRHWARYREILERGDPADEIELRETMRALGIDRAAVERHVAALAKASEHAETIVTEPEVRERERRPPRPSPSTTPRRSSSSPSVTSCARRCSLS